MPWNPEAEQLARVFVRLDKHNMENLYYHLKHKTPICCGERTGIWFDGEGGGCISCLATMPVIPQKKWIGNRLYLQNEEFIAEQCPSEIGNQRLAAVHMFQYFIKRLPNIIDILKQLTEEDIRYAIYRALLMESYIDKRGDLSAKGHTMFRSFDKKEPPIVAIG
jgi:hypothetical protein